MLYFADKKWLTVQALFLFLPSNQNDVCLENMTQKAAGVLHEEIHRIQAGSDISCQRTARRMRFGATRPKHRHGGSSGHCHTRGSCGGAFTGGQGPASPVGRWHQ